MLHRFATSSSRSSNFEQDVRARGAATDKQGVAACPITALHDALVRFFADGATMDEVRQAVLSRGDQLQSRGIHGPSIIADIKAIARQAARKTGHEISERSWQSMLAPLALFF